MTKILSAFGIVAGVSDSPGLGGANVGGSAEAEAKVAGVLDAFCGFRDEVRSLARKNAAGSEFLTACDA